MLAALNAEEFAKAFQSESGLPLTYSVEGFIRKMQDHDAIDFSPAASSCLTWLKIPLRMIDKVQPLGKRPCLEQIYDYVLLYFKPPESEEAAVFAELFYHAASPCSSCQAQTSEAGHPDGSPAGAEAALGGAGLIGGAEAGEALIAPTMSPAAGREIKETVHIHAQSRLPGWSASKTWLRVNTVRWDAGCWIRYTLSGGVFTAYFYAPPGTPVGKWFDCYKTFYFTYY